MIAVIDHRDSFTHNLVHMLHELDAVDIFEMTAFTRIEFSKIDALVFSPGPGRPEDYPESRKLYENARGKIPILGVCLGFQLILNSEGAEIQRQPRVLHGMQTSIQFDPDCQSYRKLEPPLRVGRYHSLQVNPESIPEHVNVTAWDDARLIPLSVEMPSLNIFGFQYHPDSFLTDHGQQILNNCLSGRLES